ncbi:PSD1 and planctomycete cytochrome C domain-containing protein [Allorhodopirellula heiligendammensis]|uniref:Planctomycete cytochrome C n=1 Tax=Allorhodopirellula heiligendammensis TaxID=2714739 RepID=A0A5C6BTR1_9BACT|nr:PSD1 and planctomycete cytochrome C domain-containing protein [Allorhodopirellula heiligendammensis]TWU15603.1 Planctomycete cytochrome C [Allorhodopirellula heiligendammensis]
MLPTDSRYLVLIALSLVLLGVSVAAEPANSVPTEILPADGSKVDFSRDIRPLLSDHCFACHGPDENKRESGVRLDTAEGAQSVIDLDDWETSVLLERINSDDPDMLMPPPDYHKPLSDDARSLLSNWVQQGAEFQAHWSFTPPTLRDLPASSGDTSDDPIDCWINAALEKKSLRANGPADRVTLARRVAFDLTGLPPTWSQVQRFIHDTDPDAYEKYVDGLLSSSHYGEHMARYWLDLVRYGDTHGLHLDNYREMWPYRDWVISAFNENKPMDVFITEQLAGDLLPEATLAQQIASGFNRLNVTTNEGGSIYEEVFARNVIDRTDAFGTVFLGLTTGCAVCHDHKFDPISQREFFSLSAFFNSLDGRALDGNTKDHAPVVRVASEEQQQRLDEIATEIAAIDLQQDGLLPDVDAAQKAWESALAGSSNAKSAVLRPRTAQSKSKTETSIIDDTIVHVAGKVAAKETIEIECELPPGQWRMLQLGALTDDQNTRVGASSNGNAVLSEIVLQTRPDDQSEWQAVKIASALASRQQTDGDGFSVEMAVDGAIDADRGWAVAGHQSEGPRTAWFELQSQVDSTPETPTQLRIELHYQSKYAGHMFRDVQLTVYDDVETRLGEAFAAGEVELAEPLKAALAAIAKREPPADNADAQSASEAVREFYRRKYCRSPQWLAIQDLRSGLIKMQSDLQNSLPTTLVWKETTEPREARVLIRGQYDAPGDAVDRGTPAFLPPLRSDDDTDRLALAEWLTADDHPLTARVAVNRFWQQLFGTGLVKTSEDFGSQGTPPSHPELLDMLAIEFRESGWDVKAMMKRLVMTDAYQRDAKSTAEMQAIDPNNRLLARGPRFRLDAEMLRDQMLSVSGLLVDQQGGPSVKPPQPAGLWAAVGYTDSNTATFVADEGDKIYRRSVYTFWKRTSAPAVMTTFDAPSRESCTARRERTNTPLQALLMLNEPQTMAASRRLADQMIETDTTNPKLSLTDLFEKITLRSPTAGELDSLASLLTDLTDLYGESPDQATKLVGSADASLAAWTVLASTLLNLDEVVCK